MQGLKSITDKYLSIFMIDLYLVGPFLVSEIMYSYKKYTHLSLCILIKNETDVFT